jgi:peptidoglycan hydrolase-like protein with peptidoglycan-binding domain
MPYHFYQHRPGFRYRRRFYKRHWPYRWSWLHSPDSPEGPVPSPFVAWAQRVLAQVFGPIVPQDGVLGPETRGFVAQFQAQQGLPSIGDLDDATVAALQGVEAGPGLATPIPWRPEPGMPRGRHGHPGAPHPGGREPRPDRPAPQPLAVVPPSFTDKPRPRGQEPPMPQPDRSAPQAPVAPPSPSKVPTRPPRGHPAGPAGSGEEPELAPSSADVLERGRWLRRRDRIVLIGA